MGIRDAWDALRGKREPSSRPRTSVGVISPWQEGQLGSVIAADLFGSEDAVMPIGRDTAMRIPAVAKGRGLIVATVAQNPLVSLDGKTHAVHDDKHKWLQRTPTDAPSMTPWHRMAWTVDDLIFYGWSLWAVERGRDSILKAERVPFEWWQMAKGGGIEMDGVTLDPSSYILFAGPDEGLLEKGATTLRAARDLEVSMAGRVRSPVPVMELHQMTDDVLEDDEIDELIDSVAGARRDPNGALIYTPNSISLNVHGDVDTQLFVEGRNAAAMDIARHLNLPGALLDASASTASLTYSTQEGKKNEFADYSLTYWTSPIEQRLSMDDVVPAGDRVRFDLTGFTSNTPVTTGPQVKD